MKITEITEEEICFDDGTVITFFHAQDCCENVYPDFKALEDSLLTGKELEKIEIETVKDSGFRLNGVFIPCYNEQNGYYNSDLELIITSPKGEKERIDLSDSTEDGGEQVYE